jgi:two-component system NtrC family sensor kinase
LLVFLAAAIVLIITAAYLGERDVEQRMQAQAAAEASRVSETVRLALHRSMLADRRGDAYQIMEDVARLQGFDRLRLVDGTGRVAFSTVAGEVGQVLQRDAELCRACHTGGTPRHQPLGGIAQLRDGPRGRVLHAVEPIYQETSCATAACHAHAPDRTVLGVLDVALSTAALDEAIAAFRWRTLLGSAVVAFVLGLSFLVFARRHVVRPVGALVAATRRVTREDLDTEVPETFDGELGLLAGAFNAMVRSLRTARAEVQSLLGGLERKVADRTDALVAARDEMVRTEKLTSLGKLASSIAHQLNNPISGIKTFARLIGRTLEQGAPDEATRRTLLRNLKLVERECEHCSDVVVNLLDFAHDRPIATAPISLDAVVEDSLALVGNQLQIQGVEVVKRLEPLPRTLGDFGLLRQACVNVLMNACEAMPDRGRLTVETRVVEQGSILEASFQDSGPGIAPEKLARVFDPYFSTKEQKVGLGLSVVHGILQQHGGRVDIQSAPGEGTRVTLRLPVRTQGGAPAAGA